LGCVVVTESAGKTVMGKGKGTGGAGKTTPKTPTVKKKRGGCGR